MQGLKGLKTEHEFKAHTLEYPAKHLTLAAFAKKVSKLARRGNAVAPEPAQPVDAFKEFLQLDAKTVADGAKARDDQMAQDAAAAPDVNLFAKAGALGALAAGNLQQQGNRLRPDRRPGRGAVGLRSPVWPATPRRRMLGDPGSVGKRRLKWRWGLS